MRSVENLELKRIIFHCDMNNFFASVECTLNPSIKNKPVAVCGNQMERHGIVLAKNYIAKPYGISVGEPIWMAKQKCPQIVIVDNPHYDEYKKYSRLAYNIYSRYTNVIEPFGIDECWLDMTGVVFSYGEAKDVADAIRETIKFELGLTISVGISFNKIFAKLGSDMKKPDATTIITEDNFKEKIWNLPANSIVGVGHSTKKVFDKYSIKTIGDIANEDIEILRLKLGKPGIMLHNFANGMDDSKVVANEDKEKVKSISHGTTTKNDLTKNDEVKNQILFLSQEIAFKLRQSKLRANAIGIVIRDSNLLYKQYQKRLITSLQSATNIAKEAYDLFYSKYDWENNVRAITVSVMNLTDEKKPEQLNIFTDIKKVEKIEKAEKCMEEINNKFGEDTIKSAIFVN